MSADKLHGMALMERHLMTMTRGQLMSFCRWNDRNGCYTDAENNLEFGTPLTTPELRDIVRTWISEGDMTLEILQRFGGGK